MRNYIILILFLACATLHAENALQVVPTRLTEGSGTLTLQLQTEGSAAALQFDISLPAGLTPGTPVAEGRNAAISDPRTSTYEGYKSYRLLLYPQTSSYQAGVAQLQSGAILQLPVTGTLADGTYTLYVDQVILDNAQPKEQQQTSTMSLQSSYLTAGELDAQSVSLSGQVPSFVVNALQDEQNPNLLIYTPSDLGFEKNQIIGGTCANLVLSDGSPFSAPQDFSATAASYSRSGQSYEWGTLCLPFNIQSNEQVQYYTLARSSASTLTFQAVNEVQAGTPTLYKILSDKDAQSQKYTLSIESSGDVTGTGLTDPLSEVPDWQMKGSYQRQTGVTGIYYISQNQFWLASRGVTVTPFRAWFLYSGAQAAAARFSIQEGLSSDLELVESPDHATVQLRFDLQGRPIQHTSPGIQIINRKKIHTR